MANQCTDRTAEHCRKLIQKGLFEAAGAGDSKGVAKALDGGAEADRLDMDGWTALIYAAMNGHTDCVRLLLPISNPDAQDINGETALMHAIHAWHTDCISLLLPPVSNPDVRDACGRTALMVAAMLGFSNYVRLLMPFSSIADGREAKSIAEKHGNANIAAMIEENELLAAALQSCAPRRDERL